MAYPEFSQYGYRVTQELGHNQAGGRVTYLATEINTNHTVVIKQFQLTHTYSTWSGYELYQKEIDILKELDHPSIPHYLDSFQTPTGFCMIQEYKKAFSLAVIQHWTPEEVKQIAIAVLEILKYLQSRIPPIVHRDLKPENILVDDNLNVSLVDFGFARMGGGEVAVSSVVKGTLGFMPPEQIFNRQLTPASDLYSLGMTLICLLTQTKSTEVSNLIDETGKINFKPKVSNLNLSQEFVDWLDKMVEPNIKKRYSNAQEALNVLLPIPVVKPKKLSIGSKIAIAIFTVFGLSLAPGLILAAQDYFGQKFEVINTGKSKLIVSIKPNAKRSLNTVPIQAKRIYFSITLNDLKYKDYESTCQIFDNQRRLAATGQAKLITIDGQLQAWCWYTFIQGDKPGDWLFTFSVNGQLITEKTIKVISQ